MAKISANINFKLVGRKSWRRRGGNKFLFCPTKKNFRPIGVFLTILEALSCKTKYRKYLAKYPFPGIHICVTYFQYCNNEPDIPKSSIKQLWNLDPRYTSISPRSGIESYPHIWDDSSSHLSASFTLFSWTHLKFQTVLFWPLSTLFVSPRPQENHSMAWILPDTREEKNNPGYWNHMKSIRPLEISQAIKSVYFMTWYHCHLKYVWARRTIQKVSVKSILIWISSYRGPITTFRNFFPSPPGQCPSWIHRLFISRCGGGVDKTKYYQRWRQLTLF